MHSTDDLCDDYLGSGQMISRSIKKHGKCNHQLEVLRLFKDRKLLIKGEIGLITRSALDDPLCMNLIRGGSTPTLAGPDVNAKISATLTGRKQSPEHVQAMKDGLKNMSPEKKVIRAQKLSQAHTGRKLPKRTKEMNDKAVATRFANGSYVRTQAEKDATAAKNRGQKRTPEQCANISRAKKLASAKRKAEGSLHRPELQTAAKNRGQKRTPEQRANMSRAQQARRKADRSDT